MAAGVTQATLDYLARRLNEIAAQLPTSRAAVDPAALTDDIALLAHHLTYASERVQERFAQHETVHLPERHTLMRLAEAMTAVTGAMGHLTEALDCVATGFYRQAIPGVETSHLRGDSKTLRIIAAEKCSTARTQLIATAARLHTETGGRAKQPRLATAPVALPPVQLPSPAVPVSRTAR
ncbi:hypothetical protein GCM10010211_19910 [Streptomyces albospinus]|uniref:Uncharacterized protein n=1 Tax=Streptomyces albospinus TaxID=285515 RepID=A0ABQ2UZ27_9ACTN|nr:hypothetical protein [Streptomyces albospinus]GGU55244.1 hypothetical protein GCM10010211_19910 [Streptomyces albospinus]